MDPYRVVIDDLRTFNFEAQYHRNLGEATTWLWHLVADNIRVDELYLDHDLGGDDTTRPVALCLAKLAFNGDAPEIYKIYIHTKNTVGRDWLFSTLNKYYDCEIIDAKPITTDHGEWPEAD